MAYVCETQPADANPCPHWVAAPGIPDLTYQDVYALLPEIIKLLAVVFVYKLVNAFIKRK